MIDKASVFAERFKSNPQILQATVLGQGTDPSLDPYTALRALQLIKESNAMAMARQAQQPTSAPSLASQAVAPQGLAAMLPMGAPAGQVTPPAPQAPQAPVMQASGGLAALHTPDEEYAAGGIVAFAGDEDENEADTGQLVGGTPAFTSRGDPETYGKLAAMYPGAISDLQNFKSQGMTPEEYEKAQTDEMALYEKVLGKNTAKEAAQADITARKGELGKNLEEGKGIALLKAASAVAQGNNWARAFANAGAAFGDEYGRALQADKSERRSIALAEFNMADAERKERLGLFKEGRAAADRAMAARQAAEKARLDKTKAVADALAKGMNATKPLRGAAGAGGEKPLKVNEQLAAAELAFENDPSDANKNRVVALRRTVDRIRTSEAGPGKIGAQTAAITSKENIAAEQALTKHKLINKRDWKKSVEAAGGDEAAAEEQFKKKWITTNPQTADEDGAPAPKPAAAPKPTTTSKVVSMADIKATAAASGKSEKEVMDAAKAKGYTIK